MMSKVTASAPNSLETLQKAVTSEVTVNWTELWTPPSVSRWDAVFRTWMLKKKRQRRLSRTPPWNKPVRRRLPRTAGRDSSSALYLSIRGGPDDAGSGETSGAAAQGDCLVNVLFHLRVVWPYDLWRTFRLKSKVSAPGRSLSPQKHFNPILHLNKSQTF